MGASGINNDRLMRVVFHDLVILPLGRASLPRRFLDTSRLNLENFRRQLASVDALPQLCLLAVISGALTGLIMIAFRELIELGALALMPGGDAEAFEALPVAVRTGLPMAAVILIGLGLGWQKKSARRIGITHVIERFSYHQGVMARDNWFNQWWVGVISLLGGLSAGREGPSVHLGAGASGWIGQLLKLPHNSLRVLVGCGVAAGISASFNTPIAGVIFAMEVVMMEYTLTGFMPVMLASATGAVITQLHFGSAPAFMLPVVIQPRLLDIPWLLLMALVIGVMAGGFIRLACMGDRLTRIPWGIRILIAGALTGAVAGVYPQVQGIGYDSVDMILAGQTDVNILLVLVVGKLLLTAVTVACGIPVGIVGPTLVIGAAAGALFGLGASALLPSMAGEPNLYVMMGMAAMMGAVLQAPLAAIMALLELTHSPDIILYGMLTVLSAALTARLLWRTQGFYVMPRQGSTQHPLQQPLMQALSRVGVGAVMDRSVTVTAAVISRERARSILDARPTWLLIHRQSDQQKADREPGKAPLALLAADMARAMEEKGEAGVDQEDSVNLLEIAGKRLELAPIDLQATLSEAFACLDDQRVDALYVRHITAPMMHRVSGIITREAIENYYH
ncbi:H+/Cl-antiporter ClcA [Kushneria avicenniae]|uniref:H+/Cl-antiporter ClcA n=2 Tax=Kushneria avicenniae TaxID=402385 RepID=A0A1I1K202_9GAMM|nr:H+/Cl-antiporter ClcA [Kushneria avicenniae]